MGGVLSDMQCYKRLLVKFVYSFSNIILLKVSTGIFCVGTGVAIIFLYFVVCSSSSSVSTKYDPDLLKSDVALARNRVSRLKRELEQIRAEMSCTQRGVDTLAS